MKILLINTVPINGGDEALLRSTIYGLNHFFNKPEINILTSWPNKSLEYLPDLNFEYDLEYVSGLNFKDIYNLALLKKKCRLIYSIGIKKFVEKKRSVQLLFQNADLIILGAGGYLHDFYNMDSRLDVIEYCMFLNKPTVLFGQSIGPFWKYNTKFRVQKIFNRISGIYLREKKSKYYITQITGELKTIFVGTDVAFLYHKMYPTNFAKSKKEKKNIVVAMNFRKWKNKGTTKSIISKAIELVEFLLTNYNIEIHFLSTCQGIVDYVDDSVIAKKIIDSLEIGLQSRCELLEDHLSPLHLIGHYRKIDGYIGMRLHGSILSMLSGTPALNIAYESKTSGIYDELELEDSYFDYSESVDHWKIKSQEFIENLNTSREKLLPKIEKANNLALNMFSRLHSEYNHLISITNN